MAHFQKNVLNFEDYSSANQKHHLRWFGSWQNVAGCKSSGSIFISGHHDHRENWLIRISMNSLVAATVVVKSVLQCPRNFGKNKMRDFSHDIR